MRRHRADQLERDTARVAARELLGRALDGSDAAMVDEERRTRDLELVARLVDVDLPRVRDERAYELVGGGGAFRRARRRSSDRPSKRCRSATSSS